MTVTANLPLPGPKPTSVNAPVGARFELHPSCAASSFLAGTISASQSEPLTYTYTQTVKWNGLTYTCTVTKGIAKKPSNEQEAKELDAAIAEWTKATLETLLSEAKSKNHSILTGEEWEAICTDKEVFAGNVSKKVYIPRNTKDLIEQGFLGENPLKIEGEKAKAIGEAISCDDPENMSRTLRMIPDFKTLLQKTSPSYTSVGLKNLGNTCYLNDAFRQIATNPPLVQHLLSNPDLFVYGKENALYQALEEYKELEESGKKNCVLSLETLQQSLGFSLIPSDSHEALVLLSSQLTEEGQTLLYSETEERFGYVDKKSGKEHWRRGKTFFTSGLETRAITPKKGASLKGLLTEHETIRAKTTFSDKNPTLCTRKKEVYVEGKHPRILVIQAKRAQSPYSKEKKLAAADILKREKLDSTKFKELQSIYEKESLTDGEKIQIVDFYLKKYESFKSPALKDRIDKIFPLIKNEDEIEAPLEMTLPETVVQGTSPTMRLQSFSLHSKGHYTTYYTGPNGKYYKSSDETVQEVDQATFLSQAKKAAFWVYNAVDLEKKKPSKKSVFFKESIPLGGEIACEIVSGNLRAVDRKTALVNPTNTKIQTFHKDLEEEKPLATAAMAQEVKSSWLKRAYDSKSILAVHAPERHLILHTPEEKTPEETISKVLSYALTHEISRIAFPASIIASREEFEQALKTFFTKNPRQAKKKLLIQYVLQEEEISVTGKERSFDPIPS